ncbi:MAG: hypothetical protein IPO92_19700 [Saprospiraceae bacterium]|nr:hypothetical protein [Saprospiraceae bacterium]
MPGLFLGSMATASLTNPAVVGTASLKFFAFVDVNGNGDPDPLECRGDTIVYLVTVNPFTGIENDDRRSTIGE